MSTTSHVSILLFLAVCFSSSVFCDSLPPILGSDHFHININILTISISNDLPPSPTKLYFLSDFQKTQVEIKRGEPYVKLLNFDTHNGLLKWNKCAEFSVYIPGLEGDHQRIYWSAREDGIYHSWDNLKWDKREIWDHYC